MAQSVTAHIIAGPTLPTRCGTGTGDVFIKTTATIGLYVCSSANTWSNLLASSVVNPGQTNYGTTAAPTPPTFACPNDTVTGTTVGLVVKISASNVCINETTADANAANVTGAAVGICYSGCGTAGSSQIVPFGPVVPCTFDGTTTFGHMALLSNTTAGRCIDSGANTLNVPVSQSRFSIGRILDSGASGNHNVLLQYGDNPLTWNTLVNVNSQLGFGNFTGGMLLRTAAGGAGTSFMLGGATTSDPCIADSGTLIKFLQAGASACANDTDISARLFAQQVQSGIACAGTIAPTGPVFHVTTSACAIATITAPTIFATSGYGGCITIIPDVAFSFTTAGNINNAVQSVIGKAVQLCYDNATNKWYPEHTYTGLVTWNCTSAVTANATLFLTPGFTAACTDTNVNDSVQVVGAIGTVANLYVTQLTASNQVTGIVYTVLKNGSAQTMTCTINSGNNGTGQTSATACNDTTIGHTFTVAAGDQLELRFVTVTGETAQGPKAIVTLAN